MYENNIYLSILCKDSLYVSLCGLDRGPGKEQLVLLIRLCAGQNLVCGSCIPHLQWALALSIAAVVENLHRQVDFHESNSLKNSFQSCRRALLLRPSNRAFRNIVDKQINPYSQGPLKSCNYVHILRLAIGVPLPIPATNLYEILSARQSQLFVQLLDGFICVSLAVIHSKSTSSWEASVMISQNGDIFESIHLHDSISTELASSPRSSIGKYKQSQDQSSHALYSRKNTAE